MKSWGIGCCLYGHWHPPGHRLHDSNCCPLDCYAEIADSEGKPVPAAEGKTWHGIHDEKTAGLVAWSQIEEGDLSADECFALIKEKVLDGLKEKDLFPHFVNMVQQKVNDATGGRVKNATCKQIESCWEAHLVSDYAYTYWWRKRNFVKEVGDRVFRQSVIDSGNDIGH